MGDDVLQEREIPCPCGKGHLVSQLVEHDEWASGRHVRHSVRCDVCQSDYRRRSSNWIDYLIPAAVAEQLEGMEQEIRHRQQALGRLAEDRYGPQFVEFVTGLRFRTTMKDVVGDTYESIGRFRKRTRTDSDVESAARQKLRAAPTGSLVHLKIRDAEIERESEAIAAMQLELKAAEEHAEKIEFPYIAQE